MNTIERIAWRLGCHPDVVYGKIADLQGENRRLYDALAALVQECNLAIDNMQARGFCGWRTELLCAVEAGRAALDGHGPDAEEA